MQNVFGFQHKKTLIQRMRESSWESFVQGSNIIFCEKHEINVPEKL